MTPVEKIMQLIDKLPEADRITIANAYYIKPEKELSSKVIKLKKIFMKLSPEEQQDFVKSIWARMLDTWPEWFVEISIEEESNLNPNQE